MYQPLCISTMSANDQVLLTRQGCSWCSYGTATKQLLPSLYQHLCVLRPWPEGCLRLVLVNI